MKRIRKVLASALASCAIGALVCGCAAARRTNVIPTTRLRVDPRLADGQYVFMQHCNQCHVGGAAGLGPSLNDKPLPYLLVKFQVRNGLGAMPRFPKYLISDSQLEDVVQYMDYLRRHREGPARG